jgi:peroxiredoxin
MPENKQSSPWVQRLTYLLLFFLMVETVLLVMQNRQLKDRLNSPTQHRAIESLKAGDQTTPRRLKNLVGGEFEIPNNIPSRKTLVFVFSTTCPHCEKNLTLWNHIAARLKPAKLVDVVGVSVNDAEKTRAYCATKKLDYVTLLADSIFMNHYKVKLVPQMILIAGNGKVLQNWTGELNGEQEKELMDLVGPS